MFGHGFGSRLHWLVVRPSSTKRTAFQLNEVAQWLRYALTMHSFSQQLQLNGVHLHLRVSGHGHAQ
eukprot:2458130-Amphidinium_carterae.1